MYVFREEGRVLIMDKLSILKTLNREAFIQEEALRIDEEAEFSICHGNLRTIQIVNEFDLMKMAEILQATIHFASREDDKYPCEMWFNIELAGKNYKVFSIYAEEIGD